MTQTNSRNIRAVKPAVRILARRLALMRELALPHDGMELELAATMRTLTAIADRRLQQIPIDFPDRRVTDRGRDISPLYDITRKDDPDDVRR